MAKYKVKVNSVEKIEELLQEIYDEACRLLNEVNNNISKLETSSNLVDTSFDDKAKYTKAMHDFIGDKDRAIKSKFEIAKFMGEMLKFNGDANAALNDSSFAKNSQLDLKSIRNLISESNDGNNIETIDIR